MNITQEGEEMSNLRDKHTDEEWEALEKEAFAVNKNDKAKEQAIKDIQDEQRRDKEASTPHKEWGRD